MGGRPRVERPGWGGGSPGREKGGGSPRWHGDADRGATEGPGGSARAGGPEGGKKGRGRRACLLHPPNLEWFVPSARPSRVPSSLGDVVPSSADIPLRPWAPPHCLLSCTYVYLLTFKSSNGEVCQTAQKCRNSVHFHHKLRSVLVTATQPWSFHLNPPPPPLPPLRPRGAVEANSMSFSLSTFQYVSLKTENSVLFLKT